MPDPLSDESAGHPRLRHGLGTPCPSFAETAWSSGITEYAVPLIAVRGDECKQAGTAVMLRKGLAMTAKHVLDWAWRSFEGERMGNAQNLEGTFSLQAIQSLDEGRAMALWDIRKVYMSPYNDIAFLKLAPASEHALRYDGHRTPKMHLLPPPVGSKVAALGYPNRPLQVERTTHNVNVRWDVVPVTATGLVRQVHERARDRVRLPFPCFQVNARFDDSMSGGPVFDPEGRLCGLICQSLPPTVDGEEHVSYVTTLWPSMATMIDIDRVGYPSGIEYPILELANMKALVMDGHDRLMLVPGPDGSMGVALKS